MKDAQSGRNSVTRMQTELCQTLSTIYKYAVVKKKTTMLFFLLKTWPPNVFYLNPLHQTFSFFFPFEDIYFFPEVITPH